MPKIDEKQRFYLEKTPFKTEEKHWEYIMKLANELQSELVDIGAPYTGGANEELAKALHYFLNEDAVEHERTFGSYARSVRTTY